MILKPIRLGEYFLLLASILCAAPAVAQFQHAAPTLPLSSEGSLSFERSEVTFAPQSTGIENCVNVAINNTTDHPRLLTKLESLDPKHFYISSPAPEMLPLTIGPNTSFYLNLCFKAEQPGKFTSGLLAIFQSDTIRLDLSGTGVKPPEVMPVPKATDITKITHRGHQWLFQFGLATRGTVHLALEDISGKSVRNFPFEALKTPGYYEVAFDERNDVGKKLPPGTYVLRLEVTDIETHTVVHSSQLVKIR